jgi:hypothetical protein
MKSFVVNARRAAFGWPFYVTWNLAAYAKEQEGPSAKAKVARLEFPAGDLYDCAMGVRVLHCPRDDMASRTLGPSPRTRLRGRAMDSPQK